LERRACVKLVSLVSRKLLLLAICLLFAPLLLAAEPRFVNALPLRSGLNDAPEFLAIADFTGDGRADILAASATSVRVLSGTSERSFAHAISTSINGARVVGAVDLNGDGRPELLLQDRDRSGFRTMTALADGRFAEGFRSSFNAYVLVAARFDADAHIDIAAIDAGYVHLFPGDGTGNFGAPVTTSIAIDGVRGAFAGDFDADGRTDIAVDREHAMSILWNEGARAFSQPMYHSGDVVAAGDCNGDGVSDVISFTTSSDAVIVFYGQRNTRAFAENPARIPVDNVTALSLHDVNGDGRQDVVVAAAWAQIAGIATAEANNTFNAPLLFMTPPDPQITAFGDVDGDGALDFISASEEAPPIVSLVRGKAGGAFDAPIAIDIRAAIGTTYSDAIRGLDLLDVNGDGRRDLVVLDWRDSRVCVLVANEQGGFERAAQCVPTEARMLDMESLVVAGDLDGDGYGDVIVTQFNQLDDHPHRWIVMHGRREGTFRKGAAITGIESFQISTLAGVTDLTGDGKPDLLGASGLLYPGNGDGTFRAPVATGIEELWSDTAFADFDNDGRTDVLVRRGNPLVVYRNRGNAVFEKSPESWSYETRVIGDFDRDGILDLMVGSGAKVFQRGKGDGTFEDVSQINVSPFEGGSLGGDFDRDGNIDVATGASVMFGNGAGGFRSGTAYPDAMHPGKYSLLGVEQRAGEQASLILHRWFAEMLVVLPLSEVEPELPAKLTLSSNGNPLNYGELSTIAAALTNERDAVQPTGAIRFDVNGETEALVHVDDEGKAELRTYFDVGTSTVTATYVGDERFASASASTQQVIVKAATQLTATTHRVVSNRLVASSTFTLNERIYIRPQLSASGYGVYGSPLVVRKGAEVIATLTLSSVSSYVSISTYLLGVGTHTLTLEWPGDDRYLGSSTTITVTVEAPAAGPRRRPARH
jgi:Bacterial Ig-like domain (group 3)/FG-GAP-like repeat